MYKQSNISLYVLVSLLLHVLFLTQYQQQNIPAFESNNNTSDLSLTNTVLRLSFISEAIAKQEQPKDSTADTVKQNRQAYKPKPDSLLEKPDKPVVAENKQAGKPAMNKVENDKHNQNQQEYSRPATSDNERNVFIERVLTAIESNKFYPRLARKRNMQEIIDVSFDLLESGDVKNMLITGRYKTLRHAARMAVLNARPFVTFPASVNFPFNIKYSMAFKLE